MREKWSKVMSKLPHAGDKPRVGGVEGCLVQGLGAVVVSPECARGNGCPGPDAAAHRETEVGVLSVGKKAGVHVLLRNPTRLWAAIRNGESGGGGGGMRRKRNQ